MKAVKWQRLLSALAVLAVAAGAQTVWNGQTTWSGNTPNQAAIVAGNFTIRTPEQLAELAFLVNTGKIQPGRTYTLANDIALNATEQGGWSSNSPNEWVPIGTRENPFRGVFDGGGFFVRGVYISNSDADYQGLFGRVVNNNNVGYGVIRRLRVAESSITGGDYVGGLVGSDSGKITDCYSTAAVEGKSYVGGLVGEVRNKGAITSSYATGDVTGNTYVGGLAGWGAGDTIRGCYATGSVRGSGDYVGGLVGRDSGYVINAYASGSVSGVDYVGGLVGMSAGNMANSYATGSVSGTSYVGGFAGCKAGGAMKNSYAAGPVAGVGNVGGFVGGTERNATVTYCYYDREILDDGVRGLGAPKSTAYMRGMDFVSLLNVAAYALKNNAYREITNKWNWPGGGDYPKLSIDTVTADIFASCFAGGSGKESDPYRIATRQHLENLAVYVNCGASLSVNGFYKLVNDIYVNDTAGWRDWRVIGNGDSTIDRWTPIGQQPSDTAGQAKVRFNGTFDGGGFVVGGVYINTLDDTTFSGRYQGLFGRVEKEGASGGAIKNLGIVKSYIRGYCNVGGLVGWNNKGSVTRCYAGDIAVEAVGGKNGGGGIGGLVGLNDGAALVINSHALVSVSGEINMAGGLVGWNTGNSRIAYSYAGGSVSVTGDDAGGLVGRNDGSTIRNCYATGAVSATGGSSGLGGNTIGGLVGMNYNATVAKCYAVGTVNGNSSVGGLVGTKMNGGRIDSSYYKINVNTVVNDYGNPREDSLMRLDTANYRGWDFNNVWAIDYESRSYPYLGMQRAAKPVISKQPAGGAVSIGVEFFVSVTASVSGGVISYQWYSNEENKNSDGAIISGATGPSYRVPTEIDMLLYYYVVVTNTSNVAVPDSVAGSRVASVASNAAKVRVGDYPDAVLFPPHMIPKRESAESATITPVPAVAAKFWAGPNPASKSAGAANIFRDGKRFSDGELRVYDALGKTVNKITIQDNNDAGGKGRRLVGAWNLTDARGRRVSEGTYLIRGQISASDGKSEKVLIILGVRE